MGYDERLGRSLSALAAVMRRLRDPVTGCPWDIEQTFATIAPYTIEEAYEVADAIRRSNVGDLKEELGDLLFQVVFHSRIAEEAGHFALADVADGLVAKMVERHPHVFVEAEARTASTQAEAWERQKAEKRARSGAGVLGDVALALPALMRAEKLTRRAASVGFDWPTVDQVVAKLDEELRELSEARLQNDASHIHEEMGDVLFVVANLARKLGVDPETALRDANAKFERRFARIQSALDGAGDGGLSLEAMEEHWNAAKEAERT